MANSATVGALRVLLSADTAQFEKALAGADASTKKLANTMKRDLEPSQARINSLVRQFAGTKEIGQAEAYAKAIGDVANANKLTAKHQADTNAAMQKALAHYKAIGQEAPAHFKALEQATRKAATSTTSLGSSITTIGSKLGPLAAAFGVTFGVSSIGSFVKGVFDAADKVGDLALKMGVSTDAAQRFQYAARQSGAEIEDVSTAIVKMNDSLAEGDKSTVKALEEAGLNFNKIRAMKPEDAFRAIADAIGRIPDPMKQAQLAIELFGKSGANLLPMIKENSLAAADSIDVMTKDQISDLKDAQQAWNNFFDFLTTKSGKALAELARTMGNISALASGSLGDLKVPKDTSLSFSKLAFNKGGVVGAGIDVFDWATSSLAARGASVKEAMASTPTVAGPKGLFDSGTDAKLKAAAENVAAALRPLTEEQKKAREELTKYLNEIKRGADVLTGKALAKRVQELSDTVAAAGGASKITTHQMKQLREELASLVVQGAKLDPVLQKIRQDGLAPMFPNLHKDTLSFQELTKNAIKAVDIFKQAPPDFVKFLPTELAPQWANGLMGMFGKPGSGSVVQEGKATISMLQVMNHSMATTSQLMNALATSSSGAMRTVSKVMGFAADSVFDLSHAFKEAKGDMNAFANSAAVMSSGMSFATFGIGMVIDSINQSIADSEAARAKFRQMREEVKSLGVTMEEFKAIMQGRNSKGLNMAFDDDRSLMFLKQLKTGIENITSAAVDFGGVLPRSLQPAIQEFLKIQNLPATFRAQLEALTGAPSWKVLEERAQALGIDKGALGAGFNQAKQKDIALGFVRDLNMFADAGADVDAVLRGMADELSLLMLEAMKTGAALPKTLEPYLKKLSEMGLLLDENGNAIDMGALSFMDFEDEALEAMKDLLTEIKDILAKAFPAAADAATQAIKKLSGGLGGLFKGGGGESAGGGVSLPGAWVPPDMSSTVSLTPSMAASFDESVMLSSQQQTSTFVFNFDDRALARATVSYLPGETKRLGLNRV